MTLPRVPRSPDLHPSQQQLTRALSPLNNSNQRTRSRAPEFRQRSPSPQYQPRFAPAEVTTPRERFQDAKEMFKAMERENTVRPVLVNSRSRVIDDHHGGANRLELSRQTSRSSAPCHERLTRRSNSESVEREKELDYARARAAPRSHHYPVERVPEAEVSSRPRPRSFYESSSPAGARDHRELRTDYRDHRDPRSEQARDSWERQYSREKQRASRGLAYHQEVHDRYLDRDRVGGPTMDLVPTPGRYRHSYAEPPRLGIAALDPY